MSWTGVPVKDLIIGPQQGTVNRMANISSPSDFLLELNKRVRFALEVTLEEAGATPEEIADQAGDIIDMATIIVDELDLKIEVAPDGRVMGWMAG
jgi:hypothetical protein